MHRRFWKMHGCGNDYIYLDCFDWQPPDPGRLSIRLSDRHYGIGGDGLVLILPSRKADACMRMFNLDGSEGRMCGNAVRCVGKYLYESGRARRQRLAVETRSGVRALELHIRAGVVQSASVSMGRADFSPQAIPANLPEPAVIGRHVRFGGDEYEATLVSMGNPHCVIFCGDTEKLPLHRIGPIIERDALFPQRINVEFVRQQADGSLQARVWERGSGETLACGTGACACAAAAVALGKCREGQDIAVKLPGGTLTVRVAHGQVALTGETVKVFEGILDLP